MKSKLLATAAAVGLLVLPQAALASAPDMGMVEMNLGFGWTSDNITDWAPFDDPVTFGGKTRWLFPLSQSVQVQGDLFAEQIDSQFNGGENGLESHTDSTLFGGTAHVIHPMEHARVGVAGSIYNVDVFSPFRGKSSDYKGVNYGLVAVEGQYFTEHWTLFGQGGWFGDLTGCHGAEGCVHNGVFVRANATYFFSPNMTVNVDGNLFWGDDEARGTMSGGTARIEGEYKFADSPFSGFVGLTYEQETVDVFSDSASQDTTTIDFGVRMYLDQMTLFDFSPKGPSMNTPTFHHALTSEGVLEDDAFF